MTRLFLVVSALLAPLALGAQSAVEPAVHGISEEDLRRRVGILAHDSMRGRDTPSPELRQTAQYVASEFRRVGLEPGGDDGGYIQHYTLRRVRLDTARSQVELSGGVTWRFPADVLQLFGRYAPAGATGPAVVATGIATDPSVVAGDQLGDAVVIYAGPLIAGGNLHPQAQRTLFWIFQQDPAALFVVTNLADSVWARQAAAGRRARLSVSWAGDGTPLLAVRDGTVGPVLAAAGVELEAIRHGNAFETHLVEDLTVTVTVTPEVVQELTAPNTVGILPGSDPALRDQYIVFSAHMDHVGVGRPVAGDSIYNGADDDASGTAAVLELAEAFSMLAPGPKRSLIFLTVSGEEKGLWGSEYFGAHPPVPIEQMVANVNIDMIGRNWRDTVVAIGREHSDLGATLDRVAAAHPELDMTVIDDPWPEENFYFRSDHYNFAKRGVPILFFFTGTHEDYHRPGDHVEKIDAEKEARIVRLIFYLGLEIANAAAKPEWDPESYREIVEGSR